MAHINNITSFNDNRREINKIKTLNDEIILFTKEEAKEALRKYIVEELDLIGDELAKNYKDKIETRLNFKLRGIENTLKEFINNKVEKITERIVEKNINRVIDTEVDRRVELKLKELKNGKRKN